MRRLGLFAACIALVLTVAPSRALIVSPQLVDPKGDANAINNQGSPLLLNAKVDTYTPKLPAQIDGADILSVKFTTEFVKKGRTYVPSTLDVGMTLATKPTTDQYARRYMVTFNFAGCVATQTLVWDMTPTPFDSALSKGAVFQKGACNSKEKTVKLPSSKITGTTLHWRISVGDVGAKTLLTSIAAQTRTRLANGDFYAQPVWDYARTTKTYRVS